MDQILPKSFLESHQDEPESDSDSEDEMSLEQDVQKIELLKVLDNLCCQFIDFINRTCLTGNYFQNKYEFECNIKTQTVT